MNCCLIFFPFHSFWVIILNITIRKCLLKYCWNWVKSNNRNQLRDKTKHSVKKMLQWIVYLTGFFKLLFLSAKNKPKNPTKAKQKNTLKRLPLCKDHSQCPNGSTQTEGYTQVLWILWSTITFSSLDFTRICKCSEFYGSWRVETQLTSKTMIKIKILQKVPFVYATNYTYIF